MGFPLELKKIHGIVFAVLLATRFVSAGQTTDPRTIAPAQIDSTVSQLMERAHVTGAGIALFRHGQVTYLKAYGYRDTEKSLPLTPDSVMTAASLSKGAFATVVMRLVQNHTLDLDKPISQYLSAPLPEYAQYADLKGDDRWKLLTLRILLSHTSGFPNWRAFEDDRKLKIHFTPGSRFAYSGEGIALAQFVVEIATGKPLQSLMQEQLFGPFGMTRSSMVWEPRFESDYANGYDEYGRSLGPEKRAHADAAGSMQTTLRDYAGFLSALMRGKVLDTRTADVMLSPQITIHSAHQFPSLADSTTTANDGIRLRYGIGWGLYSSPNGRAFFKEGHDEGWRHLALCFRQNGDGILILTNSSNGEGIFKPLIDALLGPTSFPFDWENYTPYNLLPPLPKLKEHQQVALSVEQLRRVTGKYALSPDVGVAVTLDNGHLYIQVNDEPRHELLFESPNDFYSASSSDEYTFKPSDASPPSLLVLHLEGKDLEMKRMP